MDKLIDLKSEYNNKWKIEYSRIKFFSNEEIGYAEIMDKSNQLKANNMPALYKYCSFDVERNSINNLKKSQIHANTANNFNDPFDSMYSIDIKLLLDEALERKFGKDKCIVLKEKYLKNNDNGLDNIEKALADLLNNSKDSIRTKTWVTCFSEVYDSILMWSHYSNCHKGFCIKYDFKNCEDFTLLSPVLYGDKLYDINKHNDFNGKGFEFCTLLKSDEWKYEQEWRFVLPNLIGGEHDIYEAPNPTTIYLGACVEINKNNKDLRELCDFANENKIQTYKMELSPTDYKLIPVPVVL